MIFQAMGPDEITLGENIDGEEVCIGPRVEGVDEERP